MGGLAYVFQIGRGVLEDPVYVLPVLWILPELLPAFQIPGKAVWARAVLAFPVGHLTTDPSKILPLHNMCVHLDLRELRLILDYKLQSPLLFLGLLWWASWWNLPALSGWIKGFEALQAKLFAKDFELLFVLEFQEHELLTLLLIQLVQLVDLLVCIQFIPANQTHHGAVRFSSESRTPRCTPITWRCQYLFHNFDNAYFQERRTSSIKKGILLRFPPAITEF